MIKFHHLLRLGSALSSGFKAELSDALGLRSQKVTLPVPCFFHLLLLLLHAYEETHPCIYAHVCPHTLAQTLIISRGKILSIWLSKGETFSLPLFTSYFFPSVKHFLFLFSLVELFFVIFSSDSNALSLFQGTLQAWNVVAAAIGNKNNCVLKKDVITLTSEALAAKVVSAVEMN